MGLGIYSGFNNCGIYDGFNNLDASKLFGPATFNMPSNGATNPLFSSFNQYAVQPGTQGGAGTSTTTEAQVSSYIDKLVADKALENNFSDKIEGSDITYAVRLRELMKDYATSENSPLTDAQYKQIKAIASAYNALGSSFLEEHPEKITLLKEIVNKTKDMTLGSVVDADEEAAVIEEQKKVEQEEIKTNAAAQYPVYNVNGSDMQLSFNADSYGCIHGEWRDEQRQYENDLNVLARSVMTDLCEKIKEDVENNGQTWTPEMNKAANETINELMPNGYIKWDDQASKDTYNATCDYQHLTINSDALHYCGVDRAENGFLWMDTQYSAVIDVNNLTTRFNNKFRTKCLANAKKIDKSFKPES